MWVEVREPNTGKLLFRFDPERDLIEVRARSGRVRSVVDLGEYRRGSELRPGCEEIPT